MAACSSYKKFCFQNIALKNVLHRRKFCVRTNFCFSSLLTNTEHTAAKFKDPRYSSFKCQHVCKSTSSAEIGGLQDSATSNNAPKLDLNLNEKLKNGPSLKHFLRQSSLSSIADRLSIADEHHPYVNKDDVDGQGRKVYFETYGCQMNVNDTEIAWSILQNNGYQRTEDIRQSDVILVMTCAIREGAEQKIWRRLKHLTGLKSARRYSERKTPLKIGILENKRDAKTQIGCIIDFDGFFVEGKFLCKEMGVTYLYKPVTESYTFLVGDYDKLSPESRVSVRYAMENVHGMKFVDADGDLPQETLSSLLRKIETQCILESGCSVIAYKGGTPEKEALTKASLCYIDLERLGCPPFRRLVHLNDKSWKNPCKLHKYFKREYLAHCPQFATWLFKKWLLS